jgi:hypothetical protein
MKRIFYVLLALVLTLSLTGGALAASTTNPPKTAYFTLSGWAGTQCLTIRLNGTIKISGGPVKIYAIHGEWPIFQAPDLLSVPLVGTGHVLNGQFHFSIAGQSRNVSANEFYHYIFEGIWDLAAPRTVGAVVGTFTSRVISDAIGGDSSGGSIMWADPTTVVLPKNAQGQE